MRVSAVSDIHLDYDENRRWLHGSSRYDYGGDILIYGHSHINVRAFKDGTSCINNAYGYPHETRRTARELLRVFGS